MALKLSKDLSNSRHFENLLIGYKLNPVVGKIIAPGQLSRLAGAIFAKKILIGHFLPLQKQTKRLRHQDFCRLSSWRKVVFINKPKFTKPPIFPRQVLEIERWRWNFGKTILQKPRDEITRIPSFWVYLSPQRYIPSHFTVFSYKKLDFSAEFSKISRPVRKEKSSEKPQNKSKTNFGLVKECFSDWVKMVIRNYKSGLQTQRAQELHHLAMNRTDIGHQSSKAIAVSADKYLREDNDPA